ncbi:MAG: tRNA epoxyqueuosine(34) reductase QueG [Magnetococcales bacterium]|nr:tRNA epoxyqueuosine(34) reductase QueG [Magnetococcales bacterium]
MSLHWTESSLARDWERPEEDEAWACLQPVPHALDTLKEQLRALVLAAGFDVAGFAPPTPPPHAEHFLPWLAAGCQGDMAWMARHPERRLDPNRLMDGLGVIVVAGVGVRPPEATPGQRGQDPGLAAIAAHARRRDYHAVLKQRLKRVVGQLEGLLGRPVNARVLVDTAPVLEKPLAVAAGLGWIGKNTLLIHPRFGAWLLLAELLLDVPLPPDGPLAEHCGACDLCIRACPTSALTEQRRLDARRCLAYHTIESRQPLPPALARVMGRRVYGCDDCLAVCPFNRFALVAEDPAWPTIPELTRIPLTELARLDEAGFRHLFRGTPVRRVGWQRFRDLVHQALADDMPPGARS